MESTGTKGIILRNVSSNWIYYFISMAIGFFMMPFIVHRLGTSIYGVWVLILSVTGYTGLLDLGVKSSTIKYIAQYNAIGNYDELNRIINTTRRINRVAALLVLLICFSGAILLDRFLKINPAHIYDFKITLLILGISSAFSFSFSVFSGIIEGHKRTDLTSIIEISTLIIQTILTVFAVLQGRGLIALGIILLIANVIRQITRYIFAIRIFPQLKIDDSLFSKRLLKKIFSYSLFMFLITLSSKIIFRTDNFVIGIVLGASPVTLYNIGLRFVEYYSTIQAFSTGVLVPFASESEAKNDTVRLKKILLNGTRYSYLLTGLIAPFLIILGKDIIALWMGKTYLPNYNILLVLIIPYLFVPAFFIIGPLLQGIGNLKFYALTIVLEGIINLALSIILAKKIGLIGVALGTAIPFLIFRGIILQWYVIRMLKITITTFIRETVFPTLIPSAAVVAYLLFLVKANINWNYFMLFSNVLIVSVGYALITYFMAFKTEEKKYYLSLFNRLVLLK